MSKTYISGVNEEKDLRVSVKQDDRDEGSGYYVDYSDFRITLIWSFVTRILLAEIMIGHAFSLQKTEKWQNRILTIFYYFIMQILY